MLTIYVDLAQNNRHVMNHCKRLVPLVTTVKLKTVYYLDHNHRRLVFNSDTYCAWLTINIVNFTGACNKQSATLVSLYEN